MRPFLVCLCLLAALVGGSAVAAASPADVIADYEDDGHIDGDYSPAELSGALELAHRTRNASYGATAAAIEDAQAEALAGVRRDDPDPAPAAPAATPPGGDPPTADRDDGARDAAPGKATPAVTPRAARDTLPTSAAERLIPTPPVPEPGARVPWPFLGLSVLAFGLAAAGLAAAAYRRLAHR